jgi:Ulp1 family protease
MTTLKDKGPEAITSWTNINVFQKKLVFIPVNTDLHFLLCVVVNPGLIANNLDSDLDPTKERAL